MFEYSDTPITFENGNNVKFRRCPRCGQVFQLNTRNFHINRSVPSGLQSRCRSCANELTRQQYRNNPRYREYQRLYQQQPHVRKQRVYLTTRQMREDEQCKIYHQGLSLFHSWFTGSTSYYPTALMEYTGLPLEVLKAWREEYQAFRDAHNGDIQIDHIIPASWFDLTDPRQRMQANSRENIQFVTVAQHKAKHSIFNTQKRR